MFRNSPPVKSSTFFVPGGHDRVRNRAGGGRAGRHVHRDASRQRFGLRKVPDLGNNLIADQSLDEVFSMPGSDCCTAVEGTPRDNEVVGSLPADWWAR